MNLTKINEFAHGGSVRTVFRLPVELPDYAFPAVRHIVRIFHPHAPERLAWLPCSASGDILHYHLQDKSKALLAKWLAADLLDTP